MTFTTEYAPERGIIRLRTAHVEAIVGGDQAVLDPRSPLGEELHSLGVVADGRLDAPLGPVLRTLRTPTRRFGLRSETGQTPDRTRGWIGRDGVVTVAGDASPDAVQDIRFSPRPSSVARTLAQLIGLGPARIIGGLTTEPMPWGEITRAVRTPEHTSWATEAFGPGVRPALHHLRWTSDPRQPATTALVLVSAGPDGHVEVTRHDELHRLTPVSSTQIWAGLCRLATGATG